MRHDMATDRLLGISNKHGATTRIRHDLIGNVDGHVELLAQLLQLAQKLTKPAIHKAQRIVDGTQMNSLVLTLSELAATDVVDAEQRSSRVNDLSKAALNREACVGDSLTIRLKRSSTILAATTACQT